MYGMKGKKYFLYLTSEERHEIIQCLIEKKNQLIHLNRCSEPVDDVICKMAAAKVKKLKVKI